MDTKALQAEFYRVNKAANMAGLVEVEAQNRIWAMGPATPIAEREAAQAELDNLAVDRREKDKVRWAASTALNKAYFEEAQAAIVEEFPEDQLIAELDIAIATRRTLDESFGTVIVDWLKRSQRYSCGFQRFCLEHVEANVRVKWDTERRSRKGKLTEHQKTRAWKVLEARCIQRGDGNLAPPFKLTVDPAGVPEP